MSLFEKLSWRYATKKFDPTKKIAADKLQQVLDTVRLSPSSMGLQHYRILMIENPEVRARLRQASYGQAQITDSSQVIVFAAETNIDANYVQAYIDEIAKTRNVTHESLEGFKQSMLGTVNKLSPEAKLTWAHEQAHIALGVLVAATADLDIDICPMGGFDKQQYDEILGLKEKGLTSSVIGAIGYRAADDPMGGFAKVRKPGGDLFIHV
ncbi:NAD(P)H-dependent oxidoreductase [Mucilaginibacter ginkgonis]|uniref:NAD(P)H-dependent oxidoreductase n=1 Tax=Mucilaginibacter ginkgonis TaxID=2682091 RepID=A0A6I4HXJ1_9SPHI|nr:NAD(P)H-dependent oxidoreductase [Mucilaginibacter ginkgonis]QQL49382.1 NAD(P)H-dependent oxidoreductase [Mucilaginibacter ginkgonis]